tara:strand:+ start:22199 stop:22813 length:615 start_codon:yes stop_codon:yes gene_type:complete
MKLWNSVCKTDPAHTKHVAQRGGFTAIDAMYQIQTATEQFGPVGIGWGWDFDLSYPENGTVVAMVTLWHGNKNQTVKQVGQKSLGANRADEDAVKKAVTDGLTKCLSYLGFNADVFLGKFDDNKYVAEMKVAHAPAPAPTPAVVTELRDLIDKVTDVTQLQTGFTRVRDELKKLQSIPDHAVAVNSVVSDYQARLTQLNQEKAS